MPHDFATRLAVPDLTNLVAYLASRRERDASHAPVRPGGITPERLSRAVDEPQNWLTYWGSYQATHYSGLTQITPANASTLRAAWTFAMPGDAVLQTTPLVVDGVMYATQPGAVVAVDARTGRLIWRSTRQRKVRSPYEINPFNRGAAIAGDRLFVGTLDAALVALDARTGNVIWETQVADSLLGYSLTSAPLVVKTRLSSASPAASSARAASSTRTTSPPVRGPGAGIPFQRLVSSATTPGKATAGCVAAARCG